MISDLTIIYGVLGFLLASYSVIANDSAQTLGTFIASNRETKWYWQWLVMSSVLVATLTYGYMSGDICIRGEQKEVESSAMDCYLSFVASMASS